MQKYGVLAKDMIKEGKEVLKSLMPDIEAFKKASQ
jgi:hypothetical protein